MDRGTFDLALEGFAADPESAFELVRSALSGDGSSYCLIAAAVAFVPEERLQDLADLAADRLSEPGRRAAACAVFEELNLQAVETLRVHLARFDASSTLAGSLAAVWAWRAADSAELDRQLESLRNGDPALRLERILESGDVRRIVEALDVYDRRFPGTDRQTHLRDADLDETGGRLFAAEALHVIFPSDLAPRGAHPSWHLTPLTGRYRFGGEADVACPSCGARAHRLIDLREGEVSSGPGLFDAYLDPPADPAAPLPSAPPIEVVTCRSCLNGLDCLPTFRHAADGSARPSDAGRCEPECHEAPFAEAWVGFAPTPPRWAWQREASWGANPNLHRVGGRPTWVQRPDYPDCPDCGRAMPFLLQLASGLPTADGRPHHWGDMGICYVFYCERCRVSASRWQCT